MYNIVLLIYKFTKLCITQSNFCCKTIGLIARENYINHQGIFVSISLVFFFFLLFFFFEKKAFILFPPLLSSIKQTNSVLKKLFLGKLDQRKQRCRHPISCNCVLFALVHSLRLRTQNSTLAFPHYFIRLQYRIYIDCFYLEPSICIP